jgi:parallel beta-helix repeat protein
MDFQGFYPPKSIYPRRRTGSGIPTFLIALLILAGIAMLFMVEAGHAQGRDDQHQTAITACGTVISQPGRYYLANDLKQCFGVGISITVSNVQIELRGHTIEADNMSVGAIEALGGDNALSNLEITGPGTLTAAQYGMVLGNVHSSFIHDLVVVHNYFGISIQSGDFTSTTTAQATASCGNWVTRVTASDNIGHGISVNGGNNNLFEHDNLSGNGVQYELNPAAYPGHGLLLYYGQGNVVRSNTADGNQGSGIDVGTQSSGNVIEDNHALSNLYSDLNDESNTCSNNTWRNNSFDSNSPACVQ